MLSTYMLMQLSTFDAEPCWEFKTMRIEEANHDSDMAHELDIKYT